MGPSFYLPLPPLSVLVQARVRDTTVDGTRAQRWSGRRQWRWWRWMGTETELQRRRLGTDDGGLIGIESKLGPSSDGGMGRSWSSSSGWWRRMWTEPECWRRMGTKPELRRRRMWTQPERCPFAIVVLCRRRPSASVGVGGPAQQRDGARSADAAPLPAPPLRHRRRSTRPPPAGSPPLWRARQDPRRGRRSWRERRQRVAPRRTRRRRGW